MNTEEKQTRVKIIIIKIDIIFKRKKKKRRGQDIKKKKKKRKWTQSTQNIFLFACQRYAKKKTKFVLGAKMEEKVFI